MHQVGTPGDVISISKIPPFKPRWKPCLTDMRKINVLAMLEFLQGQSIGCSCHLHYDSKCGVSFCSWPLVKHFHQTKTRCHHVAYGVRRLSDIPYQGLKSCYIKPDGPWGKQRNDHFEISMSSLGGGVGGVSSTRCLRDSIGNSFTEETFGFLCFEADGVL
jgi:hypothetical protein